jgi:UPF0716 protein FxsA
MWLILGFLAVPLVEIALFVLVGDAIGLWPTLGLVVLSAVLGVLILKRLAALGPILVGPDIRSLRDPLSPLAGRALMIVAAGLLILPGFFSDLLGLLLLLPPVQSLITRYFSRRLRPSGTVHHASVTIDGDWTEVPASTAESHTPDAETLRPSSTLTRH